MDERDVHFEIVYLSEDTYAVDMPIAGETRSTRVCEGSIEKCLEFISAIVNDEF